MGEARAEAALAAIRAALGSATEVLRDEGSALDAVTVAVSVLEDAEELNAGKGAVLTEQGTVELSAAVADATRRAAGAVALVTRARNPVQLARRVLEDGRHVLVAGPAADELAAAWGLPLAPPDYFVTDRRRRALARHRQGLDGVGTVGAVARDSRGHLASATSTGGVMGAHPGRVGDSPILGAGTWADDRTCALSATGDGEAFLRASFAHEVHARLRYTDDDLDAACAAALAEVSALGGTGGCVAVDAAGNVALPFNAVAMVRGWCIPGGPLHTGIDPGEGE